MSEFVERAEKLRSDVGRNLNNLSPAVRMVAGESLRPVLEMAQLMVEMAHELKELRDGRNSG